jgi:hypothetical protein
LKKDYGNDIIEKLTIAKHRKNKITAFEYKAYIDHYKEEIIKLKQSKGL